jgi:hypothetical protein
MGVFYNLEIRQNYSSHLASIFIVLDVKIRPMRQTTYIEVEWERELSRVCQQISVTR